MDLNRVIVGDCRETMATLPEGIFQCCVTSPPYWGLRDYGVAGQLGLEATPDEYIANMVEVFRGVRRVLRDDGTLWLNIGDSYASNGGHADTACNDRRGSYNIGNRPEHDRRDFRVRGAGAVKAKDLVGIPWMLAFALRADGWWLRADIVWHKPNPMPESVTDRPTKSHEYVFLLAKSDRYFYDADAIRETADPRAHRRKDGGPSRKAAATPMTSGVGRIKQNSDFAAAISGPVDARNSRTVWTIALSPYGGAHFATFPPKLAERCILAGSKLGSAVLDPFMGSGTVGQVAESLGRKWLGCELNPKYAELAGARTAQTGLPFGDVA